MRIAIAGFQHETNTFVQTPTGIADFKQADSWPELLIGRDVIAKTSGMNLPIAGFAQAAEQDRSIELIPVLWCSAEPGGAVIDAAFDEIAQRIVTGVLDTLPLDALYLDLHGAMVCQSYADGEGELLRRLRAAVGFDIPVIVSLDMHANITAQMVDLADLLCIFRTYPHIDMAKTGARAFRWTMKLLDGYKPAKAWRQMPYLIPLHAQHTEAGAAKELYASLAEIEEQRGALAEIALGFTAADIADTGPSLVTYAQNQEQANRIADGLQAAMLKAETRFDTALLPANKAVAWAKAHVSDRPIIIADVQDNPGAGASSDTTWLIRELVAQQAPMSLVGLMHDPKAAALAHRAGVGGVFETGLGGRHPGGEPYHATFQVVSLSDGHCQYTGEMYRGGTATLGPSAALLIVGTQIQIVVTSIRNQCLDQAHFTHFGLEPAKARIVCVKSTAHFRADFAPIAAAIVLAMAPGDFPCELATIDYQNLRSGVRLGPLGE